MNTEEIKIHSQSIYNGKILNIRKDTVRLPDGSTALREVVEHNGGACVLALNEKNEIFMVRQFRYGAGKPLWELPAGKLEKDENPALCAARELEEEIGYRAEKIIPFGILHPTPAYCQEIIHIYRAEGLIKSKQKLDDGEFLEVAAIPFEKALEMVYTGEITDAKTVIAILRLQGEKS
jgi:ADP-ribose pyrophosphatase